MARTRRPAQPETPEAIVAEVTQSIQQSTALIASAVRLAGPLDYSKSARLGREWQQLAWMFYDIVGEYRFACDWVGSMLSKATLFATVNNRDGNGPVRIPAGLVADAMEALGDGTEGQSDLLKAMGVHFTVAGECYLIGTSEGDESIWAVYASTELTARGTKWYASGKEIKSDTDPLVIRLWMPHPKNPQMANSPSRAMLPILAEIDALTKHVAAQIDSRLAGAGILWVPSEMTFPVTPVTQADGTQSAATGTGVNEFMLTLQAAMSAAITNREDASALTPIAVQAPGDVIKNVSHMTFWSELDRQAVELRNEAIRRLALGMDMPPEVLLGVADTNHWAAWAADESAIKAHTEPLLKIIARSLAAGYLRPLLRDAESEDGVVQPRPIRDYGIGVDTSQMRLRPNRSKEALELYDRGELSAVALRRETGFNEDDKPQGDEVRDWFTRKVASGSTTPELVEGALIALGVNLPAVVAPDVVPTQERPVPSLLEHPTRDLPDTQDQVRTARLEAACEQMVYRALERAGNRMKNRFGKVPGVPAADLYRYVTADRADVEHYLEDAFTGVDRFAARLGVHPDRLREALEAYCRVLLIEQREFSPDTLSMYVALAHAQVVAS